MFTDWTKLLLLDETLDDAIKHQMEGLKGHSIQLKKYIAAQRCMQRILGYEASSAVILPPRELYQLCKNHRLVWDSKTGKWRKDRRVKRD